MTDLLTRLTAARPTDADLDALWPSAERDARLTKILCAPGIRRHRRRRRVAAGAVVAGLLGAALVPSLLGSEQAAAAVDLHSLATSAIRSNAAVLQPGQWLHEQGTSLQRNQPGYQGGATYSHNRQSWTDYNGRTFVVDTEKGHPTEYSVFGPQSPATYEDPTPAFAAALPDTADGLLAYLDSRVHGSSSHAEAMYSALVELAASHTLPPRTLAAAYNALATLNHVSTDDIDVNGRPAIKVSYDEQLTHSTDAYVFDRATGEELSAHAHSLQADFVSTTTLAEVVDAVPADVMAKFKAASRLGGLSGPSARTWSVQ